MCRQSRPSPFYSAAHQNMTLFVAQGDLIMPKKLHQDDPSWTTILRHQSKQNSQTGVFLKRETVDHLWPCDKGDAAKSMCQVTVVLV
jgi:hypothetical protein